MQCDFETNAFGSFPISFHFPRRFGCEECVNIFYVSFTHMQAYLHSAQTRIARTNIFQCNGVNVIPMKVKTKQQEGIERKKRQVLLTVTSSNF